MATLGERIKQEREARGWGQRDLAERVGITQQAIYLYEREQRQPSLKVARQLAAAFGMSVDDLVRGTEALDIDRPPVAVWKALRWPSDLIADAERDWREFTVDERLDLVLSARSLYLQQETLQAKLRRSKGAPKPETT